jgi:DNA-binding FadR family transcriptional regulator
MTDFDRPGDLRRAALLMPLAAGVRADAVMERIAAAIRLGVMVDGEQLPNEVDLAAQMNVSTVTLREALQRLREQGVVETRRGRHGGSFARFQDTLPIDQLTQRLRSFSAAEWRDIGEEHIAISGRIAWLAAKRATSAELDRLRTVTEQLDATRSRAECQRADSQFHIGLAMLAQSERLAQSEVRMQAVSTELVWLPGDDEVQAPSVLAEHRAILDAVAKDDAVLARDLAEKHVLNNIQLIAQRALRTTSLEDGNLLRGADE